MYSIQHSLKLILINSYIDSNTFMSAQSLCIFLVDIRLFWQRYFLPYFALLFAFALPCLALLCSALHMHNSTVLLYYMYVSAHIFVVFLNKCFIYSVCVLFSWIARTHYRMHRT